MERKIKKVYTLSCPICGTIKYIGITGMELEKRLSHHTSSYASKPIREWVDTLKEKNLIPMIEELDVVSEKENSYYTEFYWIQQMKSWGFDLLNIKNGNTKNNYKNFAFEFKKKHGFL